MTSKPDYQTDMYYKCFCQYGDNDFQEENQDYKDTEEEEDYIIPDVSCNDIYSCW